MSAAQRTVSTPPALIKGRKEGSLNFGNWMTDLCDASSQCDCDTEKVELKKNKFVSFKRFKAGRMMCDSSTHNTYFFSFNVLRYVKFMQP